MSLSGLYNTQFPLTLDGTTSLDVSSLTIDGSDINLSNYVPYQGATQALIMGSQNIQTSYAPVAPADVVNKITLDNAIASISGSVAGSFLNKVLSSPAQTVASDVSFNQALTATGSLMTPNTATVNLGGMVLVGNNYLDPPNAPSLGLAIERTTVTDALPSKVLITDANRHLVSSGVSSTELSYVAGATSSLQNQIDTLAGTVSTLPTLSGTNTWTATNTFSNAVPLNLSGLTANRAVILDGSKNVTVSSVTDTELGYLSGTTSSVQTQLDTKASTSYVDTQDALRVAKSGDTMTGTLAMGSNKITSSYVPVNGDDLTNKTYVDSVVAGTVSLSGANTWTATNTFANAIPLNLSGLTANRVLILDVSKNVTVSSVTDTELSYVSGTTSSVQTQLNSKASTSYVDTNFLNKITTSNQSVASDELELTGSTLRLSSSAGTIDIGPSFLMSYNRTKILLNQLRYGTSFDFVKDSNIGSTTVFTLDGTDVSYPLLSASTVPYLDANKYLKSSSVSPTELGYLSGTTSSVQTQLNSKASTTYVDTQDGLRVLKAGDAVSGTLTFSSATPCIFSAFTGSRVLTTNGSKNLVESSVTTTTLGYLDATSSIQTQLNSKANTSVLANYLQLSGGNMTGSINFPINGEINWGPNKYSRIVDDFQLRICTDDELYFNLNADSTTLGVRKMLLNYNGLDISDNLTVQGTISTAGFIGTVNVSVSGVNAKTTPGLKLVSTENHYDGLNPSEAYIFNGPNGEIMIGRNTTRDSMTCNLLLGAPSTDVSEIVSTKSDGSGFLPMNFAASSYQFQTGNVGIGTSTVDTKLNVWGKAKFNDLSATAPGNGVNGSAGTRIILYPGNSGYTPYAIGIDGSTIWYGTTQTGYHKWYDGTTEKMRLYNSELTVYGKAIIQNEFYVGTEGNATSTIFMGGPTGDAGYNHTQIKCRSYNAGQEGSELVIFKGNDVYAPPGLYPDRIRLRAFSICFDVPTTFTTDPDAENIRGAFDGNGRFGVGVLQLQPEIPDNGTVNISRATRTGTHGTSCGLYVTAGDNKIAEFRDSNGTQGIGIGYNRIYGTGSTTNQDLQLYARGSGQMRYEGATHAWWASSSGLAFPTMSILSDGMLEMGNAVSIASNTITANAQQFSLRTSGPVFVGTTSWGYGTGGNGIIQVTATTSSDFSGRAQDCISCRAWNDGNYIISFHNTVGTIRGQIAGVNSSSIAYQTSSDKRLKDCIHPIEGALDIVQKLEAVHFRWKNDDEFDFGFIAQDVYKVLPHMRPNFTNYIKDCYCKREDICRGIVCEYCLVQKDEPVDENGNPKYYSLDYGKFTPYLVGAVQEQQKQIKEQKERLDVLEAREKVWVDYSRQQEEKVKKMENSIEKLASIVSQLLSK